jgi:hypothetical protein
MTALESVVSCLREAADGDSYSIPVQALIKEVMSSIENLTADQHPLGFLHIELTPLIETVSDERVRLHVWQHAGQRGDNLGNIHDHTWELSSMVLLGALKDYSYSPQEDSNGRYTGIRVTYGDRNSFEPCGSYSLLQINERIVKRGVVYQIPARTVHQTEIIRVPTLTIVRALENAKDRDGPLVLIPRANSSLSGTAVRKRAGPDHVRRLLKEIIRSLALP